MTKNMGTLDRSLRFVVAFIVAVLYLTDQIHGWEAVILGALSTIFLLTSLVGVCPLYVPFGLSTKPSKRHEGRTT